MCVIVGLTSHPERYKGRGHEQGMAVSEVSDDEIRMRTMSESQRGEYVVLLRKELANVKGAWNEVKNERDELVRRNSGEVSQLLREVAALRSEVTRVRGEEARLTANVVTLRSEVARLKGGSGGSTWFGGQKRVEMLVARLHGDV